MSLNVKTIQLKHRKGIIAQYMQLLKACSDKFKSCYLLKILKHYTLGFSQIQFTKSNTEQYKCRPLQSHDWRKKEVLPRRLQNFKYQGSSGLKAKKIERSHFNDKGQNFSHITEKVGPGKYCWENHCSNIDKTMAFQIFFCTFILQLIHLVLPNPGQTN